MSWKLCVVYDSGRRYLIPFDILNKFLSQQDIDKIKAAAKKEVRKL